MPAISTIMVMLPLEAAWARAILAGIEAACAKRQVLVEIPTSAPGERPPLRSGRTLRGVIMTPRAMATVAPLWQAADLLELGVPIVNCSSEPRSVDLLPSVLSDALAVGRLAGRHLSALGVTRIAAIAQWGMVYNQRRLDGLISIQQQTSSWDGSLIEQLDQACTWWQAGDPERSAIVVDTPRRAEAVLTTFKRPQPRILCWEDGPMAPLVGRGLSAIDLDFASVGRRAVQMIAQAGRRWPPARPLVQMPPAGVISRPSTASTDRWPGPLHPLRRAVLESLPKRPDVGSLAAALGIDHTALANLVADHTGTSILGLINPLRAEWYRSELAAGAAPASLASASGFSNQRGLQRFLSRWQ